MEKNEMSRLCTLNELAEQNGIVIFGGTGDKEIPLCELKQAFELDSRLYNRSVADLSVMNAIEIYDECIAPLNPETVLLHIGEEDMKLFEGNASVFVQKYRELITHIKALDEKCRIAVISLRNPNNDTLITEMNKYLKFIAESEQCEFGDITSRRLWNPKETKEVVSFVYSVGFVHSLTHRRPIYDLVKILFCFEPAAGACFK